MRAMVSVWLCLGACTPKDEQDSPPADDSSASTDDSAADDSSSSTGYGPDNAWYHAPDASLVPEEPDQIAWTRGSQVPNLRFTDQNGDEVWLYQFYGKQIYLDWVAAWCGPCATYAPYLESFYQQHGDEAIVLTILVQDSAGGLGDAQAVADWVAEHGSTNPVLMLSQEEVNRAFEVNTFPTISLVDGELRLAQRSVNTLYDDAWIEQVISRMEFALGGSLDNTAEICGNGRDDELDLIADCMDPACHEDPSCAQGEVTGSIAPCTPLEDNALTTVDVWRVEVTGSVAELLTDVISPETGFESYVHIKRPDATWDEFRTVGDDEWDCTFPLETFACALGWIEPGTWDLLIQPGTGGSDELDGDCVNPAYGEYAIRTRGDVTMELLHDDVLRGSL